MEAQHGAESVPRPGAFLQVLQDSLMAQMHAVERAYGKHGGLVLADLIESMQPFHARRSRIAVRSASTVQASSAEKSPMRVRRSCTICAPTPSACPNSCARLRI